MLYVIAYAAAGITFGILDALWLRWAGPNLYRPALGDLLAPSFRPVPAIVFYVLSWFLVFGLFALWSLTAWAVHAVAVWSVNSSYPCTTLSFNKPI